MSAADVGGGRAPVQQEFPELRDGPVPDAPVNRRVHGVLNDPRDGVVLVGDHGVFAQVAERQLAEHLLGGDPLPHGRGGDARKHVSGAQLPGLVQDFLDRTECIRCPEKDGLQLHGCSTKKTLPRGGTPGMAAPRKGMDGPPAARLGMRRPSGSGHVRRQAAPAGLGGPARGGPPARRSPCGAGHSQPRKAAGPAPHGNGLRAYSQNPKPIGHTNGEGVPVPATKRGTEEPPGRPQREYSHRPTRGTAATPPSPPSQASPPPARGAAPRALPGKGTAATCRTASGFRPRPLP